jgi:hypothetical protein
MHMSKTTFTSIAPSDLNHVSGGVARAAGAGGTDQNQQLQLMISQIGDSIKSLAANKTDSSSQMMPMMMMMMMGGGGGGGSSASASAPPPPPAGSFVKVNVK